MEFEIKEYNICNMKRVSFGNQSRQITITDCKFINDNLVIIAHREAAKVYIIEILKSSFNILDSITVYSEKTYHYPDLFDIDIKNNKIYIANFTHIISVINIVNNNKLRFDKLIHFDSCRVYHGITFHNNNIYLSNSLGQSRKPKKSFVVTVYNTVNQQKYDLPLEHNMRIKHLAFIDDNYIVALQQYNFNYENTLNISYDALLCLYKIEDTLISIDSIEIPNTHTDSIVYYNNTAFFTCHKHNIGGYIGYVQIEDNKFKEIHYHKVSDFPHGIHILNDKLMYTSYSKSSFNILDITTLFS